MRFVTAMAIVFAEVLTVAGEPPPTNQNQTQAEKHPEYLVHLNCSPLNQRAVESTLKMAHSLANDQVRVTLFVDLQAVMLAESPPSVLDEGRAAMVDALFAKLEKSGVRVLVWPRCVSEMHVDKTRIRKGARLTLKEEVEATTARADKIFEYKEPVEEGDNQNETEALVDT